MVRFLETAVGIGWKSNQDLEGRQYERLRVVSELAVETRLGWTGELILIFYKRGGQQLCSSLLAVMVMSKYAMKNHRERRRGGASQL